MTEANTGQGVSASQYASTVTSPPSIYSELLRLRRTLGSLLDASKSEGLHLLDDQTVKALGIDQPPTGSHSNHLTRRSFGENIARLRTTARAWRKQAVELREASLTGPAGASASLPSSSTFDRYLSLRKEKSQNIAHLESKLQPLEHLKKLIRPTAVQAELQRQLPAVLYAGALKQSDPLAVSVGKRKREAAEGDPSKITSVSPTASRSEAVKLLGCLAAALEDLARTLGLETFAEAFEEAIDDKPQGGPIHTHTLTQGGKLLVLDIELGIEPSQELATLDFMPTIRVKISFTNRTNASHTVPLKQGESTTDPNTRIAELLRTDVLAVARLLLGLSVNTSPVHMSVAELRLRMARSHFNRYRLNVLRLLHLDQLSLVQVSEPSGASDQQEATSSAARDPFAALHQIANNLQAVASSEASFQGSTEVNDDEAEQIENRLLYLGHGLPLIHTGLIGVSVAYSFQDVAIAKASISRAAGQRGFATITGLEVPPQVFLLEIAIEGKRSYSSSSVSSVPPSFPDGVLLPPLPDLSSGTEDNLAFVAKLDPPVILPRRLVSNLAKIVGLPVSTKTVADQGNSTNQERLSQETEYASILGLIADKATNLKTPLGAQIRYQSTRRNGASCGQNSVSVSSIPFRSLEQLYAAIEVLQEATAVQRLMQSLTISLDTEAHNNGTADSLNHPFTAKRASAMLVNARLVDVTHSRKEFSPSVESISTHFAINLSSRIHHFGHFFVLSCNIHRDVQSSYGYRVNAHINDTLALLTSSSSHRTETSHLELDGDVQWQMGKILGERGDLKSAVDLLLKWTWEKIDELVPEGRTLQHQSEELGASSGHEEVMLDSAIENGADEINLVSQAEDSKTPLPTQSGASGNNMDIDLPSKDVHPEEEQVPFGDKVDKAPRPPLLASVPEAQLKSEIPPSPPASAPATFHHGGREEPSNRESWPGRITIEGIHNKGEASSAQSLPTSGRVSSSSLSPTVSPRTTRSTDVARRESEEDSSTPVVAEGNLSISIPEATTMLPAGPKRRPSSAGGGAGAGSMNAHSHSHAHPLSSIHTATTSTLRQTRRSSRGPSSPSPSRGLSASAIGILPTSTASGPTPAPASGSASHPQHAQHQHQTRRRSQQQSISSTVSSTSCSAVAAGPGGGGSGGGGSSGGGGGDSSPASGLAIMGDQGSIGSTSTSTSNSTSPRITRRASAALGVGIGGHPATSSGVSGSGVSGGGGGGNGDKDGDGDGTGSGSGSGNDLDTGGGE